MFVDAARAIGAKTPRILVVHILPNTFAPLIVLATYVCAESVLVEAALSFFGAGTPNDIPTWGGIMANGRSFLPPGHVGGHLPGHLPHSHGPRHQRGRGPACGTSSTPS